MASGQQILPRVAWGSSQSAAKSVESSQTQPPLTSRSSLSQSKTFSESVRTSLEVSQTLPSEVSQTLPSSTSRAPQAPRVEHAWGVHAATPSGLRLEMPRGARAGTPLGLCSATPCPVLDPGPTLVPLPKTSKSGSASGKPKLSSRGQGKAGGSLSSKNRKNHKLQSLMDASSGAYEDLQKVTTLLQFLQVSGVKFLRGSYVMHLRDRGQLLPRYQDVPSNAFCALDEIGVYARACGFEGKPLVISHPWWSVQHPDPLGVQLQQICLHLETKLSPTISAVTHRPVFIDYCCLPFPVVGDRLPDGSLDLITPLGYQEEQRFQRALRNMHILYAHDHTAVLRLDNKVPVEAPLCSSYYSRGWCAFEWRISMTKRDPACSMSLSDRRKPLSRVGCALMAPAEFNAELDRLRFTVKDDREKVAALYAKVFRARTMSTRLLNLQGLSVKEMLYVARALPSYAHLQAISLWSCFMSDEVSDALTEKLENGAAPCLHVLKTDGSTEPPLNYPQLFSTLEKRMIDMDMNLDQPIKVF